MLQKKIALQLRHVTKRYQLHHFKPILSDHFLHHSRTASFVALQDVSLTVYQGEIIGIVGHNGTGKTTLLKIISGITTQNHGTVTRNGRVVSLIDLEAGFHPDLSGRENIMLNGLVIGMSKREIRDKQKLIIEFADIGQFIDEPLYTYSQGMKLRLGFAVAVHSNPDILILDENIAVADQAFQEKSTAKIHDFFAQNKTVIIVSHWLEYLKEHCQRIVWMEKGKVKEVGSTRILKKYS